MIIGNLAYVSVSVRFPGGENMIKVTRLNNSEFWVNADLILFIEETPDTIISLTTGAKIVVREPAQQIIEAVVAYRRRIFSQPPQVVERNIGVE